MSSPRFMELLKQMQDIHERKNAGYSGHSVDPFKNFRYSEMIGISPFKGCLVRLSDKFARVMNLVSDPKNEMVGEPIRDTLLDLACYSLIAICLYEEEQRETQNDFRGTSP